VRRAYRDAALRLHPDRNTSPGDTELFLAVNEAYEVLINPEKRAEYDQELARREEELRSSASFSCRLIHSRKSLLKIPEPQVHYVALEIQPASSSPSGRPPINLAIVIDRSTSMQGQRLDQVRAAALAILRNLDPLDSASVVAFSDRAELIVSPEQAREMAVARARLSLLQAGGGTEIAQGMSLGMEQLRRTFMRHGVNHMVLLTDGRTYGDEDLCLRLADQAAEYGITISSIGIGSDWSDRLVDDLAGRTGGTVTFMDTPRTIGEFLNQVFENLGNVYASRMRLDGNLASLVDLRNVFRLSPDPMPLPDHFPLLLGNLMRDGKIEVLLEFIIHPVGKGIDHLTMAHLEVQGDVLGLGTETQAYPLVLDRPLRDEPDTQPPPEDLISALSYIALYRMQEKARHEAERGQSLMAARRLENLATHLLAAGQRDLAKAALNEAARVTQTRHLSGLGEKILKYGTRLLLLPPKSEAG
jgi:Ca-activated chloride channel family protein